MAREKILTDFGLDQIKPAGQESWFSRQVPVKRARILRVRHAF